MAISPRVPFAPKIVPSRRLSGAGRSATARLMNVPLSAMRAFPTKSAYPIPCPTMISRALGESYGPIITYVATTPRLSSASRSIRHAILTTRGSPLSTTAATTVSA